MIIIIICKVKWKIGVFETNHNRGICNFYDNNNNNNNNNNINNINNNNNNTCMAPILFCSWRFTKSRNNPITLCCEVALR